MGSSSRIDILRDQHQSEQEYIIEREGEYTTLVYHSVVSLDRGRDFIILFIRVVFERARWVAMSLLDCTNSEIPHIYMNSIIKVTSPVKAYYTVVYWSRILSLPLYYILLV